MTPAAAISWVVFIAGLVTACTFLTTYLVGIRIWRARPPLEEPGTRRARRFILALTLALMLRYATGVANLIATGGHPADSVPAVTGSVLSVFVQIYLLVLLVQQRRDDEAKAAAR